ncbi:hypothetical protein H6G96_30300 [Nostoc sp. FACHB-892]|uniref:hypothetical protein n=1 Tax=Nostoc sp. FACHB-892 TaxID=2692843 RepID=UPI001996337D|nr:hypothetical protein [Nostoc sp. FACHB-892]MBD2730493.1 hypothetical protein [Nostoc sp. FACHB-892]
MSKSIFIYLLPVKLLIEDMELIEKVYKDNCQAFTILTQEYELDSIEEIKQLDNKRYTFIEITSRNPYIHLILSSDNTEIYSFEDDVNSTGIVTKLKDILISRRSPFIYSASTWSFIIQICITILAFLSLPNLLLINETTKYTILCLELILFLIQIFFLKFGTKKFPVVYVKNKTDKTSFLLEHKNSFITGVIAFVVQLLVLSVKETMFK